ncbi:hypothetical protein ACFFS2_00485 [Streptomyces aurantiacus]|uniref:Uncharacterized protein n=1 Tax=Streptomyces aurantiacus TaxID=47760 RepID=A0A7G1NYD5_9ACTN|nr:hypothetical protein [Streptomyces aurantiacus]BCL26730.1 hypothetical protein GCM10017557_15890 [Streptomyces aurantiacus]
MHGETGSAADKKVQVMPRFTEFDASSLRHTSAVEGGFPWRGQAVTLIRIDTKGIVTQATRITEKRAMLTQAGPKDLVLAAWPGQWSQDVFLVDDLKAAREEVG